MSSAASGLVGNLSTLEDVVKMIDVLTMESEMLCVYICTHLEEAETHMDILTMENDILCLCMNNHLGEAVSYFEKENEKYKTRKRDLEVERRNCETLKRNFDEEKGKQETLKRKFDDEKREQENLKRKFEQEKREQENLKRKFEQEKREQENLMRKFEQEKREQENLMRKFEQEKREQENLKRKFEQEKREQENLMRKFEEEKRDQENLKRKFEEEKREHETLKRKFEEEKKKKTHFETEFNMAAKTNENLLRQNERLRVEANNNQLDRCAIGFIPVYFLVATTLCYYNRQNFKGMETGNVFTILYFVVVVTLTVGYGDVVPTTLGTKLLTCLLVAIGGQVSPCLISLQSSAWRKVRDMFPQITNETGRKVLTFCLALIAIIISVLVGMLGFLYFENGKGVGKLLDNNFNGTDAFYASLMSLTTEGFGDYSFTTDQGRVFAVFWLLICVPMYVSALSHVVKAIASATGCFYSF